MWYVEVYTGEEQVCPWWTPERSSASQARIFSVAAGASPSTLASSCHVPDQVHDVAKVTKHVTVLAHTLHEGDVQHGVILGTEGEGGGVGLEVSGN